LRRSLRFSLANASIDGLRKRTKDLRICGGERVNFYGGKLASVLLKLPEHGRRIVDKSPPDQRVCRQAANQCFDVAMRHDLQRLRNPFHARATMTP
jgi:hypothetical protein